MNIRVLEIMVPSINEGEEGRTLMVMRVDKLSENSAVDQENYKAQSGGDNICYTAFDPETGATLMVQVDLCLIKKYIDEEGKSRTINCTFLSESEEGSEDNNS
jgi:hypothetical protein